MGSSQSDEEFHCPGCGALLSAGADRCWKCRRAFPQARAASGSSAQPASSAAGTHRIPPVSNGLSPFGREAYGSRPLLERSEIRLIKALVLIPTIVVAACIAFLATCI